MGSLGSINGSPRVALRYVIVVGISAFLALAAPPALAVSPPTISPSTGTYSTQQNVTLSVSPSGPQIFYTLDGSVPTTASSQFIPGTSPAIPITTPTQLNAVAFQSGAYSSVTTAYLDVDAGLAPMVFTGGAPVIAALRLRSDFGVVTGIGSPAPVTQWTDLSPNNLNATGSAGTQPIVVSRTSGDPVIGFNGTSQYLSLPSSGNFNNNFDGATMFVVTKPNALTAGSRIFDFGVGSNSNNNISFQIYSSGSYGSYWTYNGTSGTSVTSSPNAMTQGAYQLLEVTQNPSSPYTGTFYLNGVAGTSASMNAPPGSVNRNVNYLGQSSGGGNYYSGTIAEVLAYYGQSSIDTQLTNSQRMAIEAYFLQKYQILSQVPEAPIISVGNGTSVTLLQPTQVVISGQPGTITYITTDGSIPSNTSTVYLGGPIQINYSQTLKAIAIKNGVSSSVATATYVLNANQWPAPSGSDMTAPSINLQLPTASQ